VFGSSVGDTFADLCVGDMFADVGWVTEVANAQDFILFPATGIASESSPAESLSSAGKVESHGNMT